VAKVALERSQGAVAGLAFDGSSIWVADQGGGALLRLDPKANRMAARIPMGAPEAGPWGVTAGGGAVWASFEEATVLRIDPGSGKVTAKLPVPNIGAFAIGDGALWSPCCETERPKIIGGVTKVDLATRRVVVRVPIKGNPFAAAVAGGRVWVAGDLPNSMWRLNPVRNTVSAVTGSYLRQGVLHMAAGPGVLWLTSSAGLRQIDPTSGRMLATIPLPGQPAGLAVGPDAVWVTTDSGTLARVDPKAGRVTGTLQLPEAGKLALTPDAVWVASGRSLVRIDPTRVPAG